MSHIRHISFVAALLAGSALAAAPALAQPQGFHPVAHPHPARPHAPGAAYRGVRPGVGFHRGPGVAVRARPFHAIIVGHVPFARFTPAQRALWAKGHWSHRWWHGRYGWWWYTGGAWFWYDAPVYPYPTVVSNYYYEEPDYADSGPTWWYCYSPPGYYPYVPSCSMPWTPVPAQGYGPGYGAGSEQGPPPAGYEQGPPPGDEQGPPAGYDQGPPPGNEQGPPSGYDQGPPPGGYDQGPPPGYDQGPPPGDDQGPPPGYDQGPPPGDQGPPPNDNPHNSH